MNMTTIQLELNRLDAQLSEAAELLHDGVDAQMAEADAALRALARETPWLLAVEDVEASDEASLATLERRNDRSALRQIAEIVRGYALVGEHCAEGGFDGIELQCSHSSIVRGFLSPATNRRGRSLAVSGTVLVPSAAWVGPGARPVIGYAPGTQGMADRCAPSRQFSEGLEYEAIGIEGLLARGYAVAMTDYEGLGTEGVHTYMDRVSQGRALLDVVRAASRQHGVRRDCGRHSGRRQSKPECVAGRGRVGRVGAEGAKEAEENPHRHCGQQRPPFPPQRPLALRELHRYYIREKPEAIGESPACLGGGA